MRRSNETIKSLVVKRAESGMKLQDYLAQIFKLSKRESKTLLDGHRVWVNRKLIWMAHHLVQQGDAVDVRLTGVKTKSGAEETVKNEAPKKIRVLSDCDDYMVVDKPAGILSVGTKSLETMLRAQFENPEIVVVHRLDRDTSGCLLVAKSQEAFDAALSAFKTRKVTKIYQAVVAGYYERSSSTVRNELDGERAVTHIQKLIATKDASFLKIRIETGRTHQIRRHLSQLHFPVLGDAEYGLKRINDTRLLSLPRQMLHASSIELVNPLNPKQTIKAHSPLPADLRRCLRLFGMGK